MSWHQTVVFHLALSLPFSIPFLSQTQTGSMEKESQWSYEHTGLSRVEMLSALNLSQQKLILGITENLQSYLDQYVFCFLYFEIIFSLLLPLPEVFHKVQLVHSDKNLGKIEQNQNQFVAFIQQFSLSLLKHECKTFFYLVLLRYSAYIHVLCQDPKIFDHCNFWN